MPSIVIVFVVSLLEIQLGKQDSLLYVQNIYVSARISKLFTVPQRSRSISSMSLSDRGLIMNVSLAAASPMIGHLYNKYW